MSEPKVLTDEIRDYLNDLRDSQVTNMWASPEYVEKRFGLSWDDASTAVGEWMESFK